MRRLLPTAIPLTLAILIACGGSAPSPSPQAEAIATIAADPTLTADERATVQTVRARGQSMTKAAKDLQALGQEIRATVEWKTKVRTAAQIITGGQKTIENVTLSDYYAPLNKRTQDIATNCAKPAEALASADVDALSVAMVKAQGEALQRWCITEMDRLLQLSYEGLK